MTPAGDVLQLLHHPGPVVTVELRPPRSNLPPAQSMDAWIDLHQSLRGLDRAGHPIFITDNAVAVAEEENLVHLMANLPPEVDRSRVCPFLTSKHTLDYCLLHASRTASAGFGALTVLGGDRFGGPPRCLPRASQLRQRIRALVPDLPLGGWLNAARPAAEQVGYVADASYTAEFVLTQIVSHHHLDRVAAVIREMDRRGVELPVVWGVFLYRSANAQTLARLGEYFDVPTGELSAEFGAGDSAEDIAARTIRALRSVGADKVYLSNLGFRRVHARLRAVLERV